jgi:hypothetical protein
MSENSPSYGWASDFPEFQSTPPARVRERLQEFIVDASPEQIRAWRDAIPPLQDEVEKSLLRDSIAMGYSAILEYQLPFESRRPDVIFLVASGVLVVELKGKLNATQADLDQVAAYARDLRCYHRECSGRPVLPVLVPTRACGIVGRIDGVTVAGPDVLDSIVAELALSHPGEPVNRARFLSPSAYQPLPTLVKAARDLFNAGKLPRIHRAAAATEPAVRTISEICHTAALTKSRHLVLLTGVPGSGKTLVGLQAVHAKYLDDLAVERDGEKPTVPAVFLSGNGPLVEVLQHELRDAGGGGKAFVRGVKEYVKRYLKNRKLTPPEHVIVFDEAQRAYDKQMVAAKHPDLPARSEPELMVDFADRIPEWSVVVGLIGSGQEIHLGEEAGMGQWLEALRSSENPGAWTVHYPPSLAKVFADTEVDGEERNELNLTVELRFHLADQLHDFVAGLLDAKPAQELSRLADTLSEQGYHLRITRDLEVAKRYLRDRYGDNPDARFGMVASSRDKTLSAFGIPNGFQDTKNVRLGPWYGEPEGDIGGRSCRNLLRCVTEFGAQGLELDGALVAWGTDLILAGGSWTCDNARRYKDPSAVRDPLQLRKNAYRVLLTRGRDCSIVFVPEVRALDETFRYLAASGFAQLSSSLAL